MSPYGRRLPQTALLLDPCTRPRAHGPRWSCAQTHFRAPGPTHERAVLLMYSSHRFARSPVRGLVAFAMPCHWPLAISGVRRPQAVRKRPEALASRYHAWYSRRWRTLASANGAQVEPLACPVSATSTLKGRYDYGSPHNPGNEGLSVCLFFVSSFFCLAISLRSSSRPFPRPFSCLSRSLRRLRNDRRSGSGMCCSTPSLYSVLHVTFIRARSRCRR
jgi:hypothetical protein